MQKLYLFFRRVTKGGYDHSISEKSSPTVLKGSGHYWKLLKIIISIKPYLVTSNGERLI